MKKVRKETIIWDEEQLKQLKEMIDRFIPPSKIAGYFGVTRARIYQVMKQHHIPAKCRPGTYPNA